MFILKLFNYIVVLVSLLIAVGCRTLPEGEAPDGPLVPEPVKVDDAMNAEAAINYMVVSLVMKCRPIADAGTTKPKVQNNFIFSSKLVDSVQMDVWRKLINMDMIVPVAREAEHPEYRLKSEITQKGKRVGNEKKYSWKMTLERISDRKSLWTEHLEFVK